jgi:hypothetical protein
MRNIDFHSWQPATRRCSSVGIDIRLSGDQEVLVGYANNQTLASAWLEPLLNMLSDEGGHGHTLDSRNGKTHEAYTPTSLVLMLNFLESEPALWAQALDALEPLREKHYLTRFDGLDMIHAPVTIVASGNAAFSNIIAQGRSRDVFFDAPLELMSPTAASQTETITPKESVTEQEDNDADEGQQPFAPAETTRSDEPRHPLNPAVYSLTNSYYASASFDVTVGPVLDEGRLSEMQLGVVREQVRGAHARGLKVRYWDVPTSGQPSARHIRWSLKREGVDVMNI